MQQSVFPFLSSMITDFTSVDKISVENLQSFPMTEENFLDYMQTETSIEALPAESAEKITSFTAPVGQMIISSFLSQNMATSTLSSTNNISDISMMQISQMQQAYSVIAQDPQFPKIFSLNTEILPKDNISFPEKATENISLGFVTLPKEEILHSENGISDLSFEKSTDLENPKISLQNQSLDMQIETEATKDIASIIPITYSLNHTEPVFLKINDIIPAAEMSESRISEEKSENIVSLSIPQDGENKNIKNTENNMFDYSYIPKDVSKFQAIPFYENNEISSQEYVTQIVIPYNNLISDNVIAQIQDPTILSSNVLIESPEKNIAIEKDAMITDSFVGVDKNTIGDNNLIADNIVTDDKTLNSDKNIIVDNLDNIVTDDKTLNSDKNITVDSVTIDDNKNKGDIVYKNDIFDTIPIIFQSVVWENTKTTDKADDKNITLPVMNVTAKENDILDYSFEKNHIANNYPMPSFFDETIEVTDMPSVIPKNEFSLPLSFIVSEAYNIEHNPLPMMEDTTSLEGDTQTGFSFHLDFIPQEATFTKMSFVNESDTLVKQNTIILPDNNPILPIDYNIDVMSQSDSVAIGNMSFPFFDEVKNQENIIDSGKSFLPFAHESVESDKKNLHLYPEITLKEVPQDISIVSSYIIPSDIIHKANISIKSSSSDMVFGQDNRAIFSVKQKDIIVSDNIITSSTDKILPAFQVGILPQDDTQSLKQDSVSFSIEENIASEDLAEIKDIREEVTEVILSDNYPENITSFIPLQADNVPKLSVMPASFENENKIIDDKKIQFLTDDMNLPLFSIMKSSSQEKYGFEQNDMMIAGDNLYDVTQGQKNLSVGLIEGEEQLRNELPYRNNLPFMDVKKDIALSYNILSYNKVIENPQSTQQEFVKNDVMLNDTHHNDTMVKNIKPLLDIETVSSHLPNDKKVITIKNDFVNTSLLLQEKNAEHENTENFDVFNKEGNFSYFENAFSLKNDDIILQDKTIENDMHIYNNNRVDNSKNIILPNTPYPDVLPLDIELQSINIVDENPKTQHIDFSSTEILPLDSQNNVTPKNDAISIDVGDKNIKDSENRIYHKEILPDNSKNIILPNTPYRDVLPLDIELQSINIVDENPKTQHIDFSSTEIFAFGFSK